jgi:hypothetical protein
MDEDGEVYSRQRYDAHTNPDGSIEAHVWTNDDEDRGYPNTESQWDERYKTAEEFHKRVGISRTGVSGVKVTVFLDGEELTKKMTVAAPKPPDIGGISLT